MWMPHLLLFPRWLDTDVFCFIGMDLEVGWAPKVLSRSGNRQVQKGGKGHCETGKNVKAIQVPKGEITRALGDVHAQGNPHYHLGISKNVRRFRSDSGVP